MGTAGAQARLCPECCEVFDIDSSPDMDRCLSCAEEQAWHDGTTLLIGGQPRFGKGAVLITPYDLIVNAPVRRERKER